MNQVSSKLRRGTGKYFHWCPACEEMHPLPDSWQFNGNLEKPSFSPSFKHEGWLSDKLGVGVCHYNLTDGMLQFNADCTHDMKNQVVPLPDLPKELTDYQYEPAD